MASQHTPPLATHETASALAGYARVASERRDDLALQVARADEFILQLRALGGESEAT